MGDDRISRVLNERASTHGLFKDHAAASQGLKRVARAHASPGMTDEQWEAIDMILHKIARVIVGNPDHEDHWVDIGGYARLAEESIGTSTEMQCERVVKRA